MRYNKFYENIAKQKNVSPKACQQWWEAIVEVIVRDLYFNGKCELPYIGCISSETLPSKVKTELLSSGKKIQIKVPERNIPTFFFLDSFIDDINSQGVTESYRKRMRKNLLNQRDYLREKRTQDFGSFGSINHERVESCKQNFHDKLLKTRKEEDDS